MTIHATTSHCLRLLLAATPLLLGLPAASHAEPLTIQGSTTFSSRLLEPHGEAVQRLAGVKLDVIANKSIHGLMALLEGRTQMAMISSDLEGERKLIAGKRPDLPVGRLKSFEIARTRIAFIVHKSNPVRASSVADVAKVLRGEIRNWRELGGTDTVITVVTVQPGGGVPTTVRGQVLDGNSITPHKMIEIEAPRHVVQITAQLAGSLGIAQLGLMNVAPVAELKVDRPIGQPLNLVTLDEPTPAMQAVIDAARTVAAERLL